QWGRARSSAAPLKRRGATGQRKKYREFPRSIERGPIEAYTNMRSGATETPSFRARSSAAPLKQIRRQAKASRRAGFRARSSAAPLKHGDVVFVIAREIPGFRARSSAAPLKPPTWE